MFGKIALKVIAGGVAAVLAAILLVFCFAFAGQAMVAGLQPALEPGQAFAATAAMFAVMALIVLVIGWLVVRENAQDARLVSARKALATEQLALSDSTLDATQLIAGAQAATLANPARMLVGAALIGLAAGLAPRDTKKVMQTIADLAKS